MKTCTAFVTYNQYGSYEWTRICIESYKKIFPDHLMICVDHNNNPEELDYLGKQDNLIVLEGTTPTKFHGDGLDCAAEWAKQNNYDSIVFVEPDCFFTGSGWYDALLASINSGASMASTYKWDFGPYHPCGSAWILDDIPMSFNIDKRTSEEVNHVNFLKYMDLHRLIERCLQEGQQSAAIFYSMYYWDCAAKNWFQLTMLNKAELVDSTGFIHFWCSRDHSALDRAKENAYNAELLNPYLKKFALDKSKIF